jgi:hypothetical protein
MPSELELLGTLVPRLVHELNNQLSIMAGNAQLAERFLDKPDQVRPRLDAIRHASDVADDWLRRIGAASRRFARGPVAVAIARVAAAIRSQSPETGHGRWPVQVRDLPAQEIALPEGWAVHIVRESVRLSGADSGTVTLGFGPAPAGLRYFQPGSTGWQQRLGFSIEVAWRASAPAIPETERLKPSSIDWLVLFELARWLRGDAQVAFAEPDRNVATFCFPSVEPETEGG